jgi:hypothetical protein
VAEWPAYSSKCCRDTVYAKRFAQEASYTQASDLQQKSLSPEGLRVSDTNTPEGAWLC